jgi:hypothetical protein
MMNGPNMTNFHPRSKSSRSQLIKSMGAKALKEQEQEAALFQPAFSVPQLSI